MMRRPEEARVTAGPMRTDASYGCNGAFLLLSPEPGWALEIIASDGQREDVIAEGVPEAEGWEHVSIHAANRAGKTRTPTWREMCFVKDLFWEPEDVVMQLHPRRSQYVNLHPHTLHLWRSRLHQIPEPPANLVGPLQED